MEPANRSRLMQWFLAMIGQGTKANTVIEYLPDADEIERSPVPRFAQITMQVLIASFASFGLWASISQLDQVVVAQGRLVNPMPNIVVQPLETSIIQSVDVRVGQVVKKGDSLASLDATFVQADETQLRVRLNSLELQIQGLGKELKGEDAQGAQADTADAQLQSDLLSERRANYRAQQMKLAEGAARLRAALATNRHDQQLVASRLRSLKEIEAMQEKMVAQKFGAPLQLLEAQQRSKEVERDLEMAGSREQEIRRELAAFESERTAFDKGWRQKTMEDLLVLSRERDAVNEQLQKADRRHKLVTLTAPVDAVVLDIAKLSPGSIVKEAETFFTLVPLNVVLEAEVQIDSMDVGYIKLGHPVHLKLDAYPYQKHGTLDAKVRTISEDAFRRDASAKSGGDAYYVSRITLDKGVLKNMLDSSRLLPGMTLSAEIVVGQRSVISYLAWPLTKGMTEAIREP
ncbi:MAG: HlyD family type I secretion periplasmic adaptor subunit [Rhodoferax sp.]|nr:HlyD family type I secretion periplasmic adaptor subunit [Rhodoferax sp.]MBP9685717.1 HlyD family type I secretion periplasmic adaptor subunit [Rhodoferax sp.]